MILNNVRSKRKLKKKIWKNGVEVECMNDVIFKLGYPNFQSAFLFACNTYIYIMIYQMQKPSTVLNDENRLKNPLKVLFMCTRPFKEAFNPVD